MRRRNFLNFVIDCISIVSRMLIISHHSQWVLTMGCSFFALSSFPPSLLGIFRSLGSLGAGLTFILGLQFDIDDGVLWLILLWFGIESEPRTLVARQLTVRAPLLSIWEVARSQLEHVSFGLLELLPHHYDDHNEHRQQDQDAANGHSHHGAVTHLRDLSELWVCSSSLLHYSAWSDLWAVWNTKHLHISLSHISQTRLSVHNWDQPWMERAKSPAKLWHWYMYLGLPLTAPSTLQPGFLPHLSALLLRATRNKLPVINCENCLSVARLCVKHSRCRPHPACHRLPLLALTACGQPKTCHTSPRSHCAAANLIGHRWVCLCVCVLCSAQVEICQKSQAILLCVPCLTLSDD